jgi:ABC-type multidrug transport system fused ATPase/permease subunit
MKKIDPRIWSWIRPYRLSVAVIVVVAFVAAQIEAALLVMIAPLAEMVGADEQTFDGDLGPVEISVSLEQILAVAFALVVAAFVLQVVVGWLQVRVRTRWEREHRDLLLESYMAADWPTQQSVRAGRLQQLSTFASGSSGIVGGVSQGLSSFLGLALFAGVAFFLDPRVAPLILVVGVALFCLLIPLMRRIKATTREANEATVEYGVEMVELSAQSREVRVFGAEEALLERAVGISEQLRQKRAWSEWLKYISAPIYRYIGLALLLVFIYVTLQVEAVGVATIGAIILLFLRSIMFGQGLQGAYQSIIGSVPYFEQIEEAREAYARHAVPTGGAPLERVHRIGFEHVSYSYDGDDLAVADIDVAFTRGEVVGIVGPSGSGKSTLAQLLLRLRRPTNGRLVVNGEPADDYSLESWYRRVSFVPQETTLFHATIDENIRVYRPDTTRAEVEAAARGAGIHEAIIGLADGYDTLVGPSFRDLSGGQVQRIGIARALARGADVLVLDEPTSALDVHSEALIQDTLDALRGEILLVVIAHRMSTLSICDRLVVMHDGRVEASGTLAEVFEHNEFFRTALDSGRLELTTPNPPVGP